MKGQTHKGFGKRGERRFDLIDKPAARAPAEQALDAGRKSRHRYVNLKREIASVTTMEGRGLVAVMLEDDELRLTPMPVEDFLIEIRGWGAMRVVEVCIQAGVRADAPVRDLSDEQRGQLVLCLRRKEKR